MTHAVLFVDDDENILAAFRRMFRKTFDITTVSNAVEALKLFLDGRTFAVIVSDLSMPGVDGLRLLNEVQRRSPHTRRLLLSGNADLNTVVSAHTELDFDRFLTKPCSTERLATALREAIDLYDRADKTRHPARRASGPHTTIRYLRSIRPELVMSGDVLTEDLRATDGSLLLTRHEVVTDHMVPIIREAASTGRLADHLSVERENRP